MYDLMLIGCVLDCGDCWQGKKRFCCEKKWCRRFEMGGDALFGFEMGELVCVKDGR